MRGITNRTWVNVSACLALLGGAAIGGLAAGLTARSSTAPAQSTTVFAQMSPAEVVHLRFPADWGETDGGVAAPAMIAFASADGGITLFNPRPTYPIAAPSEAAISTVDEVTPAAAAPAGPKPADPTAASAPAKIALASATSKPVAAKPAHRSNAVLNESQIASIKRRLNLTPDQERYWPAVAAELRKMEYRKDGSGKTTRTASIDMSKVDVEGLKSAGFPLVMSFSDDQRRELKSLAHILGLESVMAGL
jgi:hypothetical protein